MPTSRSELTFALKSALTRVHEEVQAFRGGRIYLLQLNIAALKSIPEVADPHEQFKKLLPPGYDSPYNYFTSQSFVALIAAFEVFLQDILVAVIARHPKKLGAQQFRLAEILDASGTDELVRAATDQHLNRLMYKKPVELLVEVSELLSIDAAKLRPHWPTFCEAKARRDLGVHNGWICSDVYVRKVGEAGLQTHLQPGQSVLPLTDAYLDSVATSIDQLAQTLTGQLKDVHLVQTS